MLHDDVMGGEGDRLSLSAELRSSLGLRPGAASLVVVLFIMLKGLPPYKLQRRESNGMLVEVSR